MSAQQEKRYEELSQLHMKSVRDLLMRADELVGERFGKIPNSMKLQLVSNLLHSAHSRTADEMLLCLVATIPWEEDQT